MKLKDNFKDLLKILDKCKYIIEFLLMLIFCVNTFKIISTKAYNGYWERNTLYLLIIIGLLLFVNLIYNCIKDKDKIENMFLNFAIPVGLLFITFMLPTYTPDASSHLWKAYEISNGIFFTKLDEQGTANTTSVPEILLRNKEDVLNKYSVLNELLCTEDSYNYENTLNINSPSKGYCFIFFIGYAIGLFIARTFTLNIFIGLFLSRMINFIIVLFLNYIAIKKIPFGKILLSTYLMIPMMIQQSTAFSADSLMNALLILFIAYTLNLAFKKENLQTKEKVIFFILTIFVGISKLTYLPLLGIGIIMAKHRKELSTKQKILLGILAIAVCLGSCFMLNKKNSIYTNESSSQYLIDAGVNSSEQIHGIITNPTNYLKMLYNNFKVQGFLYLQDMIGQDMGWLSIKVPVFYIILYIVLLLISIFIENNKVVLKVIDRVWMMILAFIMIILVVTGLYIEWTGVGSMLVAGVQGRYFLPIIIIALLALCTKNNYVKTKNINVIIPLFSLLINLLFIKQVILFFI